MCSTIILVNPTTVCTTLWAKLRPPGGLMRFSFGYTLAGKNRYIQPRHRDGPRLLRLGRFAYRDELRELLFPVSSPRRWTRATVDAALFG